MPYAHLLWGTSLPMPAKDLATALLTVACFLPAVVIVANLVMWARPKAAAPKQH